MLSVLHASPSLSYSVTQSTSVDTVVLLALAYHREMEGDGALMVAYKADLRMLFITFIDIA